MRHGATILISDDNVGFLLKCVVHHFGLVVVDEVRRRVLLGGQAVELFRLSFIAILLIAFLISLFEILLSDDSG